MAPLLLGQLFSRPTNLQTRPYSPHCGRLRYICCCAQPHTYVAPADAIVYAVLWALSAPGPYDQPVCAVVVYVLPMDTADLIRHAYAVMVVVGHGCPCHQPARIRPRLLWAWRRRQSHPSIHPGSGIPSLPRLTAATYLFFVPHAKEICQKYMFI